MKALSRLAVIALFAAAVPAFLQAEGAARLPVADGTIDADEYQVSGAKSGMNYGMTLSGDVLYVALEAPAKGWVSVGFGQRMDGAFMVLGSDNGGKTLVSEEIGKGHRHMPNAAKILKTEAVRETGGKTTLEFSVPSAGFVAGGSIPLILAYGNSDSLSSMHRAFAKVTLDIPR